ncbi:MAG: histidine phosphatase family protein [Patescibacteria group bacterium]
MKLNNKYYILRHGEAISNAKQIVSSWPEKFHNPLTKNGVSQIKKAAKKLKKRHIDLMIVSDLLRTKQTAEILSKSLKIGPKFDKRLREVNFGNMNGKSAEELLYMGFRKDKVNKGGEKSESYGDVLKRVLNFFTEVNRRYQGKNILIVSHQCPLWVLENKLEGFSLKEGLKIKPKEQRIRRGEIRRL